MYERPITAKLTMMKEIQTPNTIRVEETEFQRELLMQLYWWKPKITPYNQLDPKDGRWVLNFKGGPTGFESYYADTLLEADEAAEACEWLYICAGTVNSWPRCQVRRDEVMAFLLEHIDEIKGERL